MKNETKTCDICGEKFIGYGNNAEPLVKNGICCDECNGKVIEERMRLFLKSQRNPSFLF